MNTNVVEFRGFKFEYFTDDLLGRNSVGSNKSWEDHILNFVTKYNVIRYTKKSQINLI